MLSYFAVLWDAKRSPSAKRTAEFVCGHFRQINPRWLPAMQCPGLHVYTTPPAHKCDEVVTLSNHAGVAVGAMFEWGDPGDDHPYSRVVAIGRGRTETIVESCGACSQDYYWGAYTLFTRRVSDGRVAVYRSAVSRLSCLIAVYRGVHICFSAAEDCLALNIIPTTINWASVRAQAVFGDFCNGETGLQEITCVECGEIVSFEGSSVRRRMTWDPRSIAESEACGSLGSAATALKRTTLKTVRAWGSMHESVILTLSGGLDSSIVLAALSSARRPPAITCVNYYSAADGDERTYARSMAARTKVPLIEHLRDPRVNLRMFLNCARTARPVLNFSSCDGDPFNDKLASDLGATAIFDGELGDNVFGHGLRHEVISEYLSRRGLRGSLAVTLDYAILRRISVWKAMKAAVVSLIERRRRQFWSSHLYARQTMTLDANEMQLVSAEALDAYEAELERFVHPWFADVRRLPAGKVQLIFALLVVTSAVYDSPFSVPGAPSKVSPLISEPLVNLALRIPSHLNIAMGRDRAVARAAFSADLSEQVLQRGLGKGGPAGWLRDVVDNNRQFVRETLMDGILVQQGILDRKKIEIVLSESVAKSTAFTWDVIAKLFIEGWARRLSEPIALTSRPAMSEFDGVELRP